jgi:hypothetical protein
VPTVPSCQICNTSFQHDDEYVRTLLSFDLRAGSNPIAERNQAAVQRSLERPQALGFKHQLFAGAELTRVVDVFGNPFVNFRGDKDRIQRVGRRLLRGLFFVETGHPLPARASVRLEPRQGTGQASHAFEVFAPLFSAAPVVRDREVGEGFRYSVGFHQQFAIWVIVLYDYLVWAATVEPPEATD